MTVIKFTTKSVLSKSVLSPIVLGLVLAVLQAAPAMAAKFPRTYVSNTGSDFQDCSSYVRACTSFNWAVSQTAAGGEVTVINTGNYGPFDANQSISIVNDGAGEASIVAPFGVAINVTAGVGDVVHLRGLVVDGQIGGEQGIVVNQVAAVHIQNCVFKNFEGPGAFGIFVDAHNNAQIFVSDTLVFNNGSSAGTGGVLVLPYVTGNLNVVLDRVHLENNVIGLSVDATLGTGNGAHVVLRDSVVSGNVSHGIRTLSAPGNAPAYIIVEHTSVVNNAGTGILASGPRAIAILNDDTIARNGAGISAVNSGQIISFGNNKNFNNLGPEGAPTGFFSQM